ncbi:hypothetical protein GCM10017710_08730 [Arthrobacter ramosus]
MDRRAGLEPGPAPAVDHREDAVLRAQPPDPAFTGHGTGTGVDLIGDEPVSEGRIVAVMIDGGVDQMRFFPVPGRDGVGGPLVVGLSGEIQYPQDTATGTLIGASLAASSRTSGYIIFLD